MPTEVHHLILRYSSFTDGRRLGMLSKYCKALFIDTYIFKLKLLLQSYDLQYDDLIPAMKEHGAVLTGPLLFILVGESYYGSRDTSGMDFYVPEGRMDSFEAELLAKTRYERKDIPLKFDGSKLGIYEVGGQTGAKSIRLYRHPSNGRTFTVVESEDKIATTAIFMFPTTLGMTYLTWNGLVCPYPRMFLKGYGIVNNVAWGESQRAIAWTAKYAVRGYHTFSDFGGWDRFHRCGFSPYCGRTTRTLSDPSTMRLPLSHDTTVDAIDIGLSWQLASRTFCYGSEESEANTPFDIFGRVLTSDGILLDRRPCADSGIKRSLISHVPRICPTPQ